MADVTDEDVAQARADVESLRDRVRAARNSQGNDNAAHRKEQLDAEADRLRSELTRLGVPAEAPAPAPPAPPAPPVQNTKDDAPAADAPAADAPKKEK